MGTIARINLISYMSLLPLLLHLALTNKSRIRDFVSAELREGSASHNNRLWIYLWFISLCASVVRCCNHMAKLPHFKNCAYSSLVGSDVDVLVLKVDLNGSCVPCSFRYFMNCSVWNGLSWGGPTSAWNTLPNRVVMLAKKQLPPAMHISSSYVLFGISVLK